MTRRHLRARVLRDQLVDRDVPGDVPDGDDGGLLARVELDQPAGAVVAEPRDDHPVARLEPGPGLGDRVGLLRLVLQLGQAPGEGLAGPLGLGLGLQRRLAGLLGLLAEPLEDLPLGDSAAPAAGRGTTRPGRRRARAASSARAIFSAFDWPMSPMCSRYLGWRVSSSNSTAAFSAPGLEKA